ncbi:GNAT family N-acetyltransferase [Flavobacterium sp. SM2513]|uniref:GNAT family N-acetyltransferase n=1 Tax=Flavobacterium sp. SM2513 TaxID=3424766 RepID=UPI003D7FD78A
MSKIKTIDSESTFIVRNPVLRPGLPVETCRFEGDNLPTTTHFGYFHEEMLVGIVSVFEKSNANWQFDKQIQVRGMAVLDEFQKKGIGEKLMHNVIKLAKENQKKLIWFYARKNAVPFYERLNFHKRGTAFEIEGVGTHYMMYRLL